MGIALQTINAGADVSATMIEPDDPLFGGR